MERRHVSSGTEWEPTVGYSRAVRAGSQIHVAGTTATDENGGVVAPSDPYAQTKCALEIVAEALEEAGGSLEDVVRTRLYVTDIDDWEEIGRAHGEVFGEIRPAASMVEVQRLIDPEHLVEIEAVAVGDTGDE
ncbi:RidA family protein [Natronorubrum sp. DTA7]|uniref:RidA family protein n=1 Tax=Natronorubrum sp. DTA7 TaxID=3447016 RepID=UPI003F837786